jgi:hypothetical protein
METMLKKPEIFRDSIGRFDRHGKTLAKTQKKTGLIKKHEKTPDQIGGGKPGPGRKKGVPNKVTMALKEMILASLDDVGGRAYLARLAIENSSAYSSLLGKVLPTTLSADESSGGLGVKMVFERHIVWPDGRREIEGATPKQLPAPASDVLPGSDGRVSNSDNSDDQSDT